MQDDNLSPTNEESIIDDADDASEITEFRYGITAYGADYPVDALVKRLNSEEIIVPTFDPDRSTDDVQGFQRRFVWNKPQSDRFVESLLLGLPVPGVFLVVQDDGRLLVLDGQQRLRTLQTFYQGLWGARQYRLERVQEEFNGKTYESLDPEDRRRLDNSIIHATIVRQDEPSNDQSSVYMIFERLNTGGTSLQPQEIRVALYGGRFIEFLRHINEFEPWRRIYGPKSKRLKDQELILRFFALLYRMDSYRRPMKDFLNKYLSDNRNLRSQDEQSIKAIFEQTITAILEGVGKRAFRPQRALNAAIMDCMMVGVANRILNKGRISDFEDLGKAYDALITDEDFLEAVESGTTDERNVQARLAATTRAMASLG